MLLSAAGARSHTAAAAVPPFAVSVNARFLAGIAAGAHLFSVAMTHAICAAGSLSPAPKCSCMPMLLYSVKGDSDASVSGSAAYAARTDSSSAVAAVAASWRAPRCLALPMCVLVPATAARQAS
jgi:hypothetical protein